MRGVRLHLLDLGGDIAGNGISKLFLTIAAAFAEAERDRIRERISQVKADQKSRGRFLGGTVPFGYRLVDGELVPHQAEQEAIRKVVELRAKGRSLRSLRPRCRQRATRSATRAWRASSGPAGERDERVLDQDDLARRRLVDVMDRAARDAAVDRGRWSQPAKSVSQTTRWRGRSRGSAFAKLSGEEGFARKRRVSSSCGIAWSPLRLLPAGAFAGWGSHPLAAFSRRTQRAVIPRRLRRCCGATSNECSTAR